MVWNKFEALFGILQNTPDRKQLLIQLTGEFSSPYIAV